MDRAKVFALSGLVLLSLLIAGCGGRGPLRVGSKNFTEQVILGEIIAQHLEHRLHTRVNRSLNLGGTLLAQQALVSGQIDLYPEYTGTALAAVLKDPVAPGEPSNDGAIFERVRREYARRFKIAWMDPLGINNGFAMVVKASSKFHTLSAAAAQTWKLGMGYEFEQRADGLQALQKTYGLKTASIKTMDLGLLYKALDQGQVDMIAANATDGLLSKMNLKVLEDDKHAFPPYEASIAVREESLRETPGLRQALAELSGKFDNNKMQELNYEVDGRHRSVAETAADFLKRAGLE
jgi:osmoprotectant transport system substrate-binding protein